LRGPGDTKVVFPNNDTLYSSAWLDLSQGPLVLHVPDTGDRYFVMQFMDFYTNNVAFVGKRTTGTKESDFAVVGPDWKGRLPAGLKRVDSPTNGVWLLGRILVRGKDDLPAVHALQDRCTLTPLGAWLRKEKPTPFIPKTEPPAHDLSEPLNFFRFLNLALTENSPPAREAALMSQFGQVGVGP